MGRGSLTLDQIWSATSTFTTTWSQGLESNKARRVLHYLLCRLYLKDRGRLVNTRLTLAQTTLSRKLKISRQWVQVLLARLQAEGWIEYTAPRLANGRRASCTYTIGRQMKRLLVMLSKSGNPRKNNHDNNRWQFGPHKNVSKDPFILKHRKELEEELPDARFYEKNPKLDWFRIQHEAAIAARYERERANAA